MAITLQLHSPFSIAPLLPDERRRILPAAGECPSFLRSPPADTMRDSGSVGPPSGKSFHVFFNAPLFLRPWYSGISFLSLLLLMPLREALAVPVEFHRFLRVRGGHSVFTRCLFGTDSFPLFPCGERSAPMCVSVREPLFDNRTFNTARFRVFFCVLPSF